MEKFYPISAVIDEEGECGWYDDTARNLKCPLCGEDFQHIGKEVGAPRLIDGRNAGAAWDGRGDFVVVPIAGECGHQWEIGFGFHKGNTAIFVRLPDRSESWTPSEP